MLGGDQVNLDVGVTLRNLECGFGGQVVSDETCCSQEVVMLSDVFLLSLCYSLGVVLDPSVLVVIVLTLELSLSDQLSHHILGLPNR